MSKSAQNPERMKPIGEPRKEAITIKLTPSEIEAERTRVCDLLGRRENLTASLKSVKGEYKAKLDSIAERIDIARRAAAEGRLEAEVEVQDWLTRGNEIVLVRADTNEVLHRRTATMEELQEEIGFPTPKVVPPEGFPSPEEAFGNGPS